MSITEEYKKWVREGHANFITPTVKGVKAVGDWVIELSEGTDFDHKPMFGVSVFKKVGDTFEGAWEHGKEELSKPFSSLDDAKKHMASAVRQLKKDYNVLK